MFAYNEAFKVGMKPLSQSYCGFFFPAAEMGNFQVKKCQWYSFSYVNHSSVTLSKNIAWTFAHLFWLTVIFQSLLVKNLLSFSNYFMRLRLTSSWWLQSSCLPYLYRLIYEPVLFKSVTSCSNRSLRDRSTKCQPLYNKSSCWQTLPWDKVSVKK